MATLIYAGAMYTNAVVFVGVAAFLLRAWTHRREDTEYLIASMMTITLAGYAYAVAVAFHASIIPSVSPRSWLPVDVATLSGILSSACLIHFVVRYARLPCETLVIRTSYAAATGYLILLGAGGWWTSPPGVHGTARVFDLEVNTFFFEVTPLASSFYAALGLVLVATVVVLGRLYLSGRTESKGAFIGSILLLLSGVNEMAMAMGWQKSISLVPLGYSAFIYGVILTLVTRYAQRSVALEVRTAELASRSRELETSYMQLQETERALVKSAQLADVGRLSHVIAERIQAPLAIVKSTLVQLKTVNTQQANLPVDKLKIIDTEAGQLAELVNRLLCYTRSTTAKLTPIDLQELLAPCVMRSGAITGVDATLQCEGSWPSIHGDAHLLRQLFDDLIANAIRSLAGEGKITIRVRATHENDVDATAITIADNGLGMTEEDMGKAMTPFYSTHSDHHGLGLPISQRTVEAHGGSLTLESQPGKGTTARVVVPLRPSP